MGLHQCHQRSIVIFPLVVTNQLVAYILGNSTYLFRFFSVKLWHSHPYGSVIGGNMSLIIHCTLNIVH